MGVLHNRTAGMVAWMIFFTISFFPANGQKAAVYSLSDFVDSLSHHLPLLMQKKALVSSAKAGVTEARHAYLPKLLAGDELLLASSNSLTGSYLPMAAIPSVSGSIRAEDNLQPATGNIVSIYGEYELDDFGLRKAKIENAEAYAELAQADFERELYLLKLQVGRLYFAILKNRVEMDVDEQNIDRYASIYSVITALAGSGIKAGVDSSLAGAELSKSRVDYNKKTGALNRLVQQMSYLTGIPAAKIDIDTTAGGYGAMQRQLPQNADSATNPLLYYYSTQKQLYQSAEKLVKKSYLPKIVLAAGGWGRGSSIQYNDDYKSLATGLGYQRFNYAAGLAITYDLFSGVHRNDKLAQSHFQLQSTEFALQQERLSLQNSVLQSAEQIRVAEKNLVELPYQLQAAGDAYNQKVAQYKAGIINLIDLTNASFVLYTAQTSYIETLNDWFLANLDKSAAMGSLDTFIQTLKR